MKRRQALKSIVVVSAGAIIFPYCKNEPPIPIYENLTIDKTQFNLIGELANVLLPLGDLKVKNPEPVHEFILTMANDCMPLEDCKKFVLGLKGFTAFMKEKYNNTFSKLESTQQLELFESIPTLAEADVPPSNNEKESYSAAAIQFFFSKTLQYTKQHFIDSEYFLTNHREWKFIPGGYEGCAAI